MNKIKIFLFMLFVFMIGTNNVNAMTLKPTGTSTGKKGEEVILYITLNRTATEKEVSAIDGNLSYDKSILTLSKIENLMGSNWTELSNAIDKGTFSYANFTFNTLISDTNKKIVKLIFKVNNTSKPGNTTISIKNPSATDKEGNDINITGGSHNLKILSDINTLSNLTVSNGFINFNPTTNIYNLEIDSTKVTISATKTDTLSSLSGDIGEKNLNYGTNTFKITVTSESVIKNTYTLNIVRPDGRNNINTLDSLEVNCGTINFNKKIYEYNLNVENDVTKITVKATLTDKTSKFLSGYEPRTINLKEGNNSIEIKVKAENESIKTYTINVNRKSNNNPVKSNNNYLKTLNLSTGKIKFNKNIFNYEVVVPYNIDKIKFEAKTEDDKATYYIEGNEKLIFGKNKYIIVVIAEDDSTKEYTIVVERKKEIKDNHQKVNLKNLNIKGYSLDFNSEVYSYDLKIDKEDYLIIDCILEDENSSVKIEGNKKLQNGSAITIIVTDEFNSTVEYKINIKKDESSNLSIFSLISIVSLVSIIMMIILKKIKNHFISK